MESLVRALPLFQQQVAPLKCVKPRSRYIALKTPVLAQSGLWHWPCILNGLAEVLINSENIFFNPFVARDHSYLDAQAKCIGDSMCWLKREGIHMQAKGFYFCQWSLQLACDIVITWSWTTQISSWSSVTARMESRQLHKLLFACSQGGKCLFNTTLAQDIMSV